MMAGLSYFVKSTNWNYVSAPEPHLNGRRIAWPRGKVLGGTSAINGMMYMRGHWRDYDAWAKEAQINSERDYDDTDARAHWGWKWLEM